MLRRSSRLTRGEGLAAISLQKRLASEVAPSLASNKKPEAPPAENSTAKKSSTKEPSAKKLGKSPKESITASRAREEAAWHDGVQLVLGCDEAGRGPLAGPVVAAACALPASAALIPGIGDSKTITDEAAREALYEQIIATPGVQWSARVVSAQRIDEINILMASLEAMRLSLTDVLIDAPATRRALALVDGPFSPWKEGYKVQIHAVCPILDPSLHAPSSPVSTQHSKSRCLPLRLISPLSLSKAAMARYTASRRRQLSPRCAIT